MPKLGLTPHKPRPWSSRAAIRADVPLFAEDKLRANSDGHRWSDALYPIINYTILALFLVRVIAWGAAKMGYPLAWLGTSYTTTKYTIYALLGLLILVFLLRRVGRYRLRSKVLRARGYLCPICAYDLRGLEGSDSQCPECGCVTPRRECVLLWCRFMRSKD